MRTRIRHGRSRSTPASGVAGPPGQIAYVARTPDPADARARLVALTARGADAIVRARRHRAALAAELAQRLGPRRVDAARQLLLDVVAELGEEAAVRGRRVRAPR